MSLKDALGCIGWSAFFLMAFLWIPVLGPFVSLFTPLPFLYYATKLGLKQGFALSVATFGAIALVGYATGQPQISLVCLEWSLLGLALSEILRRQWGLGRALLAGTAFMSGMGGLFLVFGALAKGLGPLELVEQYLRGALNSALGVFEGMEPDSERALTARTYGEALVRMVLRISPALAVLGSGLVVCLNIMLSRPLFRLGGLPVPDLGPLDRWKAPETLVWGLISSGFALFFFSGAIKWIGLNALIILTAIYLIQGFSILLFFLNKYRVPPWIRIGIYLVIAFQQLFFVLLSAAGLFDQWIDFRKIGREKREV